MLRVVEGAEAVHQAMYRRPGCELGELPERVKERIRGVFGEDLTAEQVVDRLIAAVRANGDAALAAYGEKLDGVRLSEFAVREEEIIAAYHRVDQDLVNDLRLAAQRISAFHRRQKRNSWVDFQEGLVGQMVSALERVGVYAPGGTAIYPSTVLMTVIPAKVAGVDEVILATPPRPDGSVAPLTLVAADIAGVDRIFKVGGALAIAALAFGTASIPRVDKIVGPGNLFVVIAKRKVFGFVDIDGLPGPTETVVIADAHADPAYCAADLLAQAEHDPLASAILITDSKPLAARVQQEIERQLPELSRANITREALEQNGMIVIAADVTEAVALANAYAPEHLCLLTSDPWPLVGKVQHAGGIFIGEHSLEALGDYVAGPSHVMPTGGTARFASPLNVDDFVKVISLIGLDDEAVRRLGPTAARLAENEGLDAHAKAVLLRLKGLTPGDAG